MAEKKMKGEKREMYSDMNVLYDIVQENPNVRLFIREKKVHMGYPYEEREAMKQNQVLYIYRTCALKRLWKVD